MAYKWRPLHLTETALAGAHFAASVALQKSFSRRPAYWIDLYYKKRLGAPVLWFVALQWSFNKQGEDVEGQHVIDFEHTSVTSAIGTLEARIGIKTNQGWLFHSVEVDPNCHNHNSVSAILREMVSKLKIHQENPKVEVVEKPEIKQSRAERFQQKQAKRKAKAEW